MADYPKEFLDAVNDLIDNWEGGYSNDPNDPGGETKFGISKAGCPDVDIKHLTRDQAIAIYYRDYWAKYKLDTRIGDPALRAKCFNMGVLMGPVTALALALKCKDVGEFRDECEKHFRAIAAEHPNLARYLNGWLRRARA
jgi:lysozyme family protein